MSLAAEVLASWTSSTESDPLGDRLHHGTTDLIWVVKTPDSNGERSVENLDLNPVTRAWINARGESRYAAESDVPLTPSVRTPYSRMGRYA